MTSKAIGITDLCYSYTCYIMLYEMVDRLWKSQIIQVDLNDQNCL